VSPSATVIWHDLECGRYRADLTLWSQLAGDSGDPVLDVGAGSGRVTLELAQRGHRVLAVDLDPELLAALDERAAALADGAASRVSTRVADARELDLGEQRFALCIVPMQTVQLLEGSAGRRAFLTRARAHLTPGATIAMAIADVLEPFDVAQGFPPPLPDVTEIGGTVYCSRPTAVRLLPDGRYRLERRREIVTPDGQLTAARDEIVLDHVSPEQLEQDGRAAGLTVGPRELVPETEEYVGSTVVMLGA
jgi:SAM-dependent methyltransferase